MSSLSSTDYDSSDGELPIDSENASASMSLADVNQMEKGDAKPMKVDSENASASMSLADVNLMEKGDAKPMTVSVRELLNVKADDKLTTGNEDVFIDVSDTSMGKMASSNDNDIPPSSEVVSVFVNPPRKRWVSKKCFFYLLLIFALVGVGVALGVVFGLKAARGSSSTSAASATSFVPPQDRGNPYQGSTTDNEWGRSPPTFGNDEEETEDEEIGVDETGVDETAEEETAEEETAKEETEEEETEEEESDEGGVSPAIPAAPLTRLEAITNYLSENGITSAEVLQAYESPQKEAAEWMSDQDSAAKPLPSTPPPSSISASSTEEEKEAYLFMFRYVMAVNYFAMGGPDWYSRMNFATGFDICDWNGLGPAFEAGQFGLEQAGVLCDDDGIPIAVDLEFNRLKGTLPRENGLLHSLKMFDVEHNRLSGNIPEEFCDLTEIQFMLLRQNNFHGTLPSCVSKWTKLKVFRVDENQLWGSIPSGVCSWSDAQILLFDKNLFEGPLPSCISKPLPTLRVFSVSDNQLDGGIPDLSAWTELEQLFLDGNFFRGTVADSISYNHKLRLLYLEKNEFTGDLNTFFTESDMNELETMDLSSNNFTLTGTLPRRFFEGLLEVLDLSKNKLTGALPQAIPLNSSLFFLSVHENEMSGNIPATLKNMENLLHLDISNNFFEGPIPDEIFEMTGLQFLFLSENDFDYGPIPAGIQNMTSLRELSCKNTNRNGPLPQLLEFDDLFLLDLDNNDFDGQIPDSYGDLTNIRYLLLNRNPSLTGNLPDLSNLRNMAYILVDGTGVTGNFSGVCSLPGFSGDVEFPTGVIALADCSDIDSGIDCDCCHCCSKEDSMCSDPMVASLDWTWENQFWRTSRNFAIDYEFLDAPQISTESSSETPAS